MLFFLKMEPNKVSTFNFGTLLSTLTWRSHPELFQPHWIQCQFFNLKMEKPVVCALNLIFKLSRKLSTRPFIHASAWFSKFRAFQKLLWKMISKFYCRSFEFTRCRFFCDFDRRYSSWLCLKSPKKRYLVKSIESNKTVQYKFFPMNFWRGLNLKYYTET